MGYNRGILTKHNHHPSPNPPPAPHLGRLPSGGGAPVPQEAGHRSYHLSPSSPPLRDLAGFKEAGGILKRILQRSMPPLPWGWEGKRR